MAARKILRVAAAVAVAAVGCDALDNGLGRKPPMGFNDWNELARKYQPWANGLNESMVLGIARALVSSGLRDKGYRYVNLDCGYSAGSGNSHAPLEVSKSRFPSGLKSLGDKIHALNLSFGIYSSGTQCCDQNVRLGMEKEDAAQFAEWTVDYVKYDDCGTTSDSFVKMRDAINASSRPMFYSIHSPWTHKPNSGTTVGPDPESSGPLANCWRTTNDIRNDFDTVMDRAHTNNAFAALAKPGQWNDPDMLEVGNGLSDAEGRSHFSLWCLMKSPLLIGTDLTTATASTLETLGNADAIAINQDPMGRQGVYIRGDTDSELWGGPLAGGCFAALVINIGNSPIAKLNATWIELSIPAGTAMDVFSIWQNKTVSTDSVDFIEMIADGSHDCGLYRLCPSTK